MRQSPLIRCKNKELFSNNSRKKGTFLFGPFPLKNNISDDFPEILPVGTEGMLQIGLKVTPLTVLNLVQSLRHIDIKRRQQPRFGFNPKFLQISCIKIKILLTQGSHPDQFHLPLQNVNKHRQLIQPGLAEEPAPLRHAVVVAELAAHIQIVVLVDVGLQVLGIGIHGAELEDIELLAVLPYPS